MEKKINISVQGEQREQKSQTLDVYAAKGSFPGEINLQWDAISNARSYVLQIREGNGNWKQVDITLNPYYMLSGLKSGHSFSFRVAAVFAEGQGEWSKPISKITTDKL